MKDFRKQQVWVKSQDLALNIYKVTKTIPQEEIYGLIAQTRQRLCLHSPDYC